MRQVLHLCWHAVLDFVYPPHCFVCKRPLEKADAGICADCANGVITDQAPSRAEVAGLCVFALSDFSPPVRRLVHALKYRGKARAGEILGAALGRCLPVCDGAVVVPVPLHGARKRERGYNQSALIARAAGRVMAAPVYERGLKRVRHTATQTHLDVGARKQNVAGAFVVSQPEAVAGRTVWLIDDVVTTGATVAACAQALFAGGARAVWVGAVARPQLGRDRIDG